MLLLSIILLFSALMITIWQLEVLAKHVEDLEMELKSLKQEYPHE